MIAVRHRWKNTKLSEVISIKHGFAFKSQYFSSKGRQIVTTPGNFYDAGGFKFSEEKAKRYDGPVPVGYVLKQGDLLIAMTEQSEGLLGSAAIIPSDHIFLHNQRLGLVQPLKQDQVDLRFIYYIFNSTSVRQQIRASASGTKVRHTSPARIGEVSINLPALPYQRRIASILSAYDDHIENNTRRIAILEEPARRIFEEWFVKFRAPGCDPTRLVDSPLGPIPEGWEVVRLEDIADDIRDPVQPSEIDPATSYVGLEHIPRRSTTLRDWGRADEVGSLKLAFSAGDVLFGKIRPYFHKAAMAPVDGVASSDAIVIRAREQGMSGIVACLVSSDAFVAHAVKTSNGTKMPRADWKVLRGYPIALPPHHLRKFFNETVRRSLRLASNLALQNRNLRAQRDLLLPKLISGEIDVSEAPKLMEAAE